MAGIGNYIPQFYMDIMKIQRPKYNAGSFNLSEKKRPNDVLSM